MSEAIALGISLVSLVLAAISLGWNIYRDIILKPRVHVSFNMAVVFHPTLGNKSYLMVSATNHGPGNVRLTMAWLQQTPLWRRIFRCTKHAALLYDYHNPLSGKLPKVLEVGDSLDLLFLPDEKCFITEPWTHVGVGDSFGRKHWLLESRSRKPGETFINDLSPNKSLQRSGTHKVLGRGRPSAERTRALRAPRAKRPACRR